METADGIGRYNARGGVSYAVRRETNSNNKEYKTNKRFYLTIYLQGASITRGLDVWCCAGVALAR